MNIDHFKYMYFAQEAEKTSDHPSHKVGALICGKDHDGMVFDVARPNFWPKSLAAHIGTKQKLGNASMTVHAEVAALYAAPSTQGASMYITDLPCPNCAKLAAEARINDIYIDSKTYNTPLGLKMRPYFDSISSLILKNAGITVHEIDSDIKAIQTIITPSPTALYRLEHPVRQISVDYDSITQPYFMNLISNEAINAPFAACLARSDLGNYSFLLAQKSHSLGLSPENINYIKDTQDKYDPIIQPINRLILSCARYGLKIDPQYLYSSQTPTSREFVNMIGANLNHLHIGDKSICRDEFGLAALKQLEEYKIIELN